MTGVTQNSVSLKWNEPDSDGGSEITNYVLEAREGVRRGWNRVGSVDVTEDCQYTVPLLTEGAQYVFRVAAENAIGVGEFAELSQTVVPKSQFGKRNLVIKQNLLDFLYYVECRATFFSFFYIHHFVRFENNFSVFMCRHFKYAYV